MSRTSTSTRQPQANQPKARKKSRTGHARKQTAAQSAQKRSATHRTASQRSASQEKNSQKHVGQKHVGQKHVSQRGAPLIVKRYVRWLFGKDVNPHRQHRAAKQRIALKVPQIAALATSSVAMFAAIAVVPGRVSSQAIDNAACQEVVQSGAEISRGQLSALVSISEGAAPEEVRSLISTPYCLLPISHTQSETELLVAREAYPLAFDPEAWVVVNYTEDGYASYDFAFKH